MSESSLVEQGGARTAHQNKAALKGSNNCALFNLQTRFDFPDIFLRKVSAELGWKFHPTCNIPSCRTEEGFQINYIEKKRTNGVL